jgi:hypothetical protein
MKRLLSLYFPGGHEENIEKTQDSGIPRRDSNRTLLYTNLKRYRNTRSSAKVKNSGAIPPLPHTSSRHSA